jgi:hypothetical protein
MNLPDQRFSGYLLAETDGKGATDVFGDTDTPAEGSKLGNTLVIGDTVGFTVTDGFTVGLTLDVGPTVG